MSVLKTSVVLLAIFASFPAMARNQTYTTSQGDVDLSKVDQLISKELHASVTDSQLRWSFNPFDALLANKEGLHNYILTFKLDNQYTVKCNFALITAPDEYYQNNVMIEGCVSKPKATIDLEKFFPFESVGLVVSRTGQHRGNRLF